MRDGSGTWRRWFVGVAALAAIGLTAFTVQGARTRSGTPRRDSSSQAATSTAKPGARAEGRVATYPGASVTVGAEMIGRLTRVLVTEQQRVTRGMVLAEFDAGEQRAALTEAQTAIASADADIALFSADEGRMRALAGNGNVSQQTVDRVVRDVAAARARRALAEATVQRLNVGLMKARVMAPIDGVVTGRLVEPGQTVAIGTPLLSIADLARRRIEAEVDEFDMARIHIGTLVTITAEGFSDQSWHGMVEEIPDAVIAPRLRPQDPARPSDTRVLLVKVKLLEPVPFKLGQRVEVTFGP